MAKYRKKPIVVDALQLTRQMCIKNDGLANPYQVGNKTFWLFYYNDHVIIETLEGKMKADIGDYIITGVNGERYPCKPDIFDKTYELVEE